MHLISGSHSSFLSLTIPVAYTFTPITLTTYLTKTARSTIVGKRATDPGTERDLQRGNRSGVSVSQSTVSWAYLSSLLSSSPPPSPLPPPLALLHPTKTSHTCRFLCRSSVARRCPPSPLGPIKVQTLKRVTARDGPHFLFFFLQLRLTQTNCELSFLVTPLRALTRCISFRLTIPSLRLRCAVR